jgi:hypothetical protein
MGKGVIADFVAGTDHLVGYLRMFFEVLPYQEKSCRAIELLQKFQNPRRRCGMRTVIEG